jgi:hypothetical protein
MTTGSMAANQTCDSEGEHKESLCPNEAISGELAWIISLVEGAIARRRQK